MTVKAHLAGLAALLWGRVRDVVAKTPAPKSPEGLSDSTAFFAALKPHLFKRFSQSQVDGLNALLRATAHWPLADRAYALATAYHETAETMRPIREYGRGRGHRYGLPGPHGGQIAYGRGYIQLTWPENYARADEELGLDGVLIANYELALDQDIAAKIMVRGMEEGWFTGRDLDDDLPRSGAAELEDFVLSRDIINGTDDARQIALYAIAFQNALIAGGDYE